MTWRASRVALDMLFGSRVKTTLPTPDDALPGRDRRLFVVPTTHEVLGTPLEGPWPEGTEVLYVAMGCFWGVERIFWKLPGVVTTAAGYMGGYTPNPTYEETCTGRTGHAEAVLVAYDPSVTSPELLLKAFWENHDPTHAQPAGQRHRHGLPLGDLLDHRRAGGRRPHHPRDLPGRAHPGRTAARSPPTLAPASDAGPFYYAEDYHQQYLHKNPNGYCNHGPNGLTCPVGVANLPAQTDVLPPA